LIFTQGDALGWYVVALSGLRKKCPTFWEFGPHKIAKKLYFFGNLHIFQA
jgi:hypothetical protein